MKSAAFWLVSGRMWDKNPTFSDFWLKSAKIGRKKAKKLKISKIQKTSFVCILKCHFHAKNGLQWVNWKRVETFRSKFSDPQNPRISYTFREKIAKYCRLWQVISRHQNIFFQFRKKHLLGFPIIQIWIYVQMRKFKLFWPDPPPPPPLMISGQENHWKFSDFGRKS